MKSLDLKYSYSGPSKTVTYHLSIPNAYREDLDEALTKILENCQEPYFTFTLEVK